ncbi:hypothetical protein RGUI_4260 (plasmid) [Rhodovulum sp. P5]|uniref:hypothetical protein n=1 Tax=Rhodovulum sp. P5 TaxID=1564506 RepID=UPI0009C20BED|nr:hypothetical protein [Rhodovulum sp. P5]ARE42286.1 hypothetical protein RGUI_4260 [Rhodovulum sp. P5]
MFTLRNLDAADAPVRPFESCLNPERRTRLETCAKDWPCITGPAQEVATKRIAADPRHLVFSTPLPQVQEHRA